MYLIIQFVDLMVQYVSIKDQIDYAIKKSFKVFVGVKKDKDLLCKFFNADQNKIKVQPIMLSKPKI